MKSDIIGKTFGCYEVLDIDEPHVSPSGRKNKRYKCKCTRCGNIRSMNASKLTHNNYQHCNKCTIQYPVKNDLTSCKFGMLTVIKRVENHIQPNGSSKVMYLCKCDCGNNSIVAASHLKSGHTSSCGCLNDKILKDVLTKNLMGMKFGKLTVVEKDKIKNKRQYWKCICECGKYRIAMSSDLLSGKTKSCGCLGSVSEYEMSMYFDSKGYTYKSQYTFDDCKDKRKLPFDFGIEDNDGNLLMLIELHGQQHYSPFTYCNEPKEIKLKNFEDRKRKDLIKETYCKKHNIPLLIIKYTNFSRKEEIFETFYNSLQKEIA